MQQGYPNQQQPPMQHQHSQYSQSASMYGPGHTSMSSSIMRRGLNPPPRFRPFMIILMVLFIGLAFIGLVMTIIAVWPGYTPVGGNPLKIAGPILLAVGGAGFIVGIINICYNNDKQKKKDARKQALMYAHSMSRSTIASAHHYPQSNASHASKQPASKGKGILKNASSTSTYNGTAKGSDQGDNDSGMIGTHSFSTGNQSYERDSVNSDVSGHAKLDNVRVEMNPDPNQKRPKPRSYQNAAYAQGGDEGGFESPPRRTMQTHSNQGFDMYDTSVSPGGGSITGAGSLTGAGAGVAGQASLTGAGMLGTPYGGSPMGAQQQPQSSNKWGRSSGGQQPSGGPPQSSQSRGHPSSGRSNQAYVDEHQGGGAVSTVTGTYQHMTTPSRPQASSHQQRQHTQGQYAAAATPAASTPSASTEV
jgi:hypothetical protein